LSLLLGPSVSSVAIRARQLCAPVAAVVVPHTVSLSSQESAAAGADDGAESARNAPPPESEALVVQTWDGHICTLTLEAARAPDAPRFLSRARPAPRTPMAEPCASPHFIALLVARGGGGAAALCCIGVGSRSGRALVGGGRAGAAPSALAPPALALSCTSLLWVPPARAVALVTAPLRDAPALRSGGKAIATSLHHGALALTLLPLDTLCRAAAGGAPTERDATLLAAAARGADADAGGDACVVRAVERGATLVSWGGGGAPAPDSLFFHAARGNWERVTPRALLVSQICRLLLCRGPAACPRGVTNCGGGARGGTDDLASTAAARDARSAGASPAVDCCGPRAAAAFELARTARADANVVLDALPAIVDAPARARGLFFQFARELAGCARGWGGVASRVVDVLASVADGDVTAGARARYALPPGFRVGARPASWSASKVNAVCASLRGAALDVIECDGGADAWALHPLARVVMASFARQDPADLGGVVRVARAAWNADGTGAGGGALLSFALALADGDGDALAAAALGQYDVQLAAAAAARAGADPRELGPLLKSLGSAGAPSCPRARVRRHSARVRTHPPPLFSASQQCARWVNPPRRSPAQASAARPRGPRTRARRCAPRRRASTAPPASQCPPPSLTRARPPPPTPSRPLTFGSA
jgi:hypothetical protein